MSMIDGKKLTEYRPRLSEEEARRFAGLAWTYPKNIGKILDKDLILAFVEILDIVVNGGFDTVDSYVQWKKETDEADAPRDKASV